jgi:uncharacterized Zn finger protein
MARYDYYGYPRYVSVAEKKARARRKLEQLSKKHPDLRPVVIEGGSLVRTWWGKAWNGNLQKYADYANRVGRGRSYVRHGAVLDLQIRPGQVRALVQGSRRSPYTVTMSIKPISKSVWKQIRAACVGQLASLQELLEGRFPKELMELFTAKGSGLFPAPKEIDFDCNCPDWATMCKHVAATLYGIGTRLDEDPGLFFVLRQAKMDDLITQAVRDRSARLLGQAKKKTARVIDDADLGDVFGIDLESAAVAENEGSEARAVEPGAAVKAQRKASAKKPKKKRTTKKAKTVAKKTKRGSRTKMKK